MNSKTLNCLKIHESAYINHLDSDIKTRSRLIELGFHAGRLITPLYKSPLGDPTAYLIEDTVIALRKEDASKIYVDLSAKEVV